MSLGTGSAAAGGPGCVWVAVSPLGKGARAVQLHRSTNPVLGAGGDRLVVHSLRGGAAHLRSIGKAALLA